MARTETLDFLIIALSENAHTRGGAQEIIGSAASSREDTNKGKPQAQRDAGALSPEEK